MSASAPSAATSALAELLEVSPQVDAAVILERDGGRLLASAPAASARMADRLGATCVNILEAAEQARTELGREPVAQVEVATPDGHVFVVADARWIVAAVTDADPTVGLVFYDLKTALRTVREGAADASSVNGSAPSVVTDTIVVEASTEVTASGDDETSGSDEESNESSDESSSDTQSSSRWRRKKS